MSAVQNSEYGSDSDNLLVPNEHTRLNWKNDVKKNLVSVIIPVYKDAKGLADTLSSLTSQSLEKDRYEVIVSNDGGAPEITEVCRKFKVKMVEIRPNMGSYFARNRAIEASSGEYLAFIDADMTAPENWLSSGIEKILSADYVAGSIEIDTSKVETVSHLYEAKYAFPMRTYLEKLHYGPTAHLFVKRHVFEKIGGFDERLRSGGDRQFGDRVFRFGFQQVYMESPSLIHPPRDYDDLRKKFKRLEKGFRMLGLIAPERFPNPDNIFTVLIRLMRSVFPPRFKTVKRIFLHQNSYKFWSKLIFLWKMEFWRRWYRFYCILSIRKVAPRNLNVQVDVNNFDEAPDKTIS